MALVASLDPSFDPNAPSPSRVRWSGRSLSYSQSQTFHPTPARVNLSFVMDEEAAEANARKSESEAGGGSDSESEPDTADSCVPDSQQRGDATSVIGSQHKPPEPSEPPQSPHPPPTTCLPTDVDVVVRQPVHTRALLQVILHATAFVAHLIVGKRREIVEMGDSTCLVVSFRSHPKLCELPTPGAVAFLVREVQRRATGDDWGTTCFPPSAPPSSPTSVSPPAPRPSPSSSPSSPASMPLSRAPTSTAALSVPPTTSTWSIWRRKRVTLSPTRKADGAPAMRKHYQSRRVRAAMRRHMVSSLVEANTSKVVHC